jgi:hypothetical protein
MGKQPGIMETREKSEEPRDTKLGEERGKTVEAFVGVIVVGASL